MFETLKQIHPNIAYQAFVDDIIISARTKQELEIALKTAHEILNSLDMKLNINKCEFLTENENETLTDLLTNTVLESKQIVKYLGQYINADGNTTNVVNKFDYGTVNSIVKNNVNHISRRAKVKLFNTYIKSKFSHLLPMIAISGQLETTWSNIRKTIFRDVINFSTFPKESAAIIGLSYYNIIIKPLLKLYEKEEKISSPKHLEFFREACKTAFKLWLSKESNNTESEISKNYFFN